MRQPSFLALAHSIQAPDHIDPETGQPKVEACRILDKGLDELERGDGIEMASR